MQASWLMRLASFCALINGTVSLPRLPALPDACQFLMAHALPHAVFFNRVFQKIINHQQLSKLPTAIYFYFS
jgi:hypothetical protein